MTMDLQCSFFQVYRIKDKTREIFKLLIHLKYNNFYKILSYLYFIL